MSGMQPTLTEFYDTHPIHEAEILAKLRAAGDTLEDLTQDRLSAFDQDHYGGTDVVDLLAARAGVASSHHVLDVCSGMGGPARWLAHTIGCRVTGIDLTESRVNSAVRLTQMVGLQQLVQFVQGDATAMHLDDATYDVVLSQEAWLHIPDKPGVVSECVRVTRPGGAIAFTDVVVRTPLTADEESRMAREMHAPKLATIELYSQLFEAHGCSIESCEDLSAEWNRVLANRHQMYRSLRDTTVARFGEQHYATWDATYEFFVGLYAAGRLGGVRMVARKPTDT